MTPVRTSSRGARRGVVAVLVAISLVMLVGFAAIAVDGGLLYLQLRKARAGADASAMAAACELFKHYPSYAGADTDGSAKAAALRIAAANGYANDDTTSTVVVNIPPQSGPYTGQASYAEVIITYSQQRFFSRIWSSDPITVQVRAVSRGRWVPFRMGILVLDPTAPGALTNNGGGSMSVIGVPTIVDSNAPDAATATGNGTCICSEFDVTGVPGTSGSGTWKGTILSGQAPTPDPLRYLPEPDPSTMVVQSKNPTHVSGTNTTTLKPGVYKGGITVTGQGALVMEPGIYYMDGGGFSFSGQGGMTAVGVMIVNAPNSNGSSEVISINGTGAINFSPPTTGIYAGISLWQVRSSTNTVSVSGNGGSSISGTFYVAGGTLSVTGNGTNDVIGSQYISDLLKLGGNGGFSVNWNPQQTARTRLINLVE
jgi:Flp pilus assembly protein TadG